MVRVGPGGLRTWPRSASRGGLRCSVSARVSSGGAGRRRSRSGSTRPSATRPSSARARCTGSSQTASSADCGTGATASRSTASSLPRTWRSVPAYVWPRRAGPWCAGLPASRQAHRAAIGQRAQSSFFAVHTSAPSSMEAAAQRAARLARRRAAGHGRACARPRWSRSAGTGCRSPRGRRPGGRWCRVRHAAVRTRTRPRPPPCTRRYRAARAAGRARSARRRRAVPLSPARPRAGAAHGADSRAGPRRGPPRRAHRRPGRRGAASGPATARTPGSTRLTGVCCSMNSLTITPQAPASGRRQGRSRACSSNQAMTGAWRAAASAGAGSVVVSVMAHRSWHGGRPGRRGGVDPAWARETATPSSSVTGSADGAGAQVAGCRPG